MPILPHFAAPHVKSEPLPEENGAGISVIIGSSEVYPSHLLFSQAPYVARSIDHVLRYRDTQGPVIQPIPSLISDCSGHPWGPTPIVKGDLSSFYLTFLRVRSSATNPPVGKMIILTPGSWRNIIVLPVQGTNIVTVADVQEAVIEWMRETSALAVSQGQGISLAESGRIPMPDGNEVEVELWQWRGLKKYGLESDIWELCL